MLRRCVALAFWVVAAGACTGSRDPATTPGARTAANRAPAQPKDGAGPPMLDAVAIGRVPAGTFGPYVASAAASRILVWAAAAGPQRKWYGVALSGGSKTSDPTVIADAPAEVGLVSVAALGGEQPRFAVFASAVNDGAHQLQLVVVDDAARRVAGPVAVAEVGGTLLWVDVLPTPKGGIACWAVREDGRAAIHAVALDAAGALIGAPAEVVTGARAWQAAPTANGVAIASVRADSARVELVRLDAAARPSPAVVVSNSPTAEADLDMAAVGEELLLAWSDHREIEPRVHVASVDGSGAVSSAPHAATSALGEQSLVRLVPPAPGTTTSYLAWENVGERTERGRVLRVAPVERGAKVGKARALITLATDDGTMPELEASTRGLSVLTLAPACPRSGACDDAALAATWIGLDKNLIPEASEPLRLSAFAGQVAPLAWGLDCARDGCIALAASEKSPAAVFAVRLQRRSDAWVSAAEVPRDARPPLAESVRAVAELDAPIADLALVSAGDRWLAAWVDYFDPATPWRRLPKPAADGRFDPPRATLQTMVLNGADAKPQTISFRARSSGGVALAPAGDESAETLLLWTALDNKVPQVFATVLDGGGKKARQKMFTRSAGEKSDVAAAAVGDGWVVAWVDERHGDAEVYAAKLNRYLQRMGPEQRITQHAGAATGVTLARAGSDVLLAWADAKDAAAAGLADIMVARLSAKDARPAAAPSVLSRTPAHSFGPALAARASGAALVWVEREGSTGRALSALLDADGRPTAPPRALKLEGSVSAAGADCQGEVCRLVVTVETPRGAGLALVDGGSAAATPLFGLSATAASTVAPALAGERLLLADQSGDKGRVRHATLRLK